MIHKQIRFLVLTFTLSIVRGVAADDLDALLAAQQAINAAMPRVNELQQKWRAIEVSSHALGAMNAPNAAVRISAAALEQELARFATERANAMTADAGVSLNVHDTQVDLQQQWIVITSGFALKLDEPAIEIRGRLAGGAVPALVGSSLRFFIAFTAIEVRELDGDVGQFPIAPEHLTAAFAKQIEQLNGLIESDPFEIALDLEPLQPIDLREQLAGVDGMSDVAGQTNAIPYALQAGAFLVDNTALRAVVEIRLDHADAPTPASPPDAPEDLTADTLNAAYSEYAARFHQHYASFGSDSGAPASLAIARSLIAKAVNRALESPSLCGSYDLAQIRAPYDVDIDTFRSDPIDCSPTMACDLAEDRRDCRVPKTCERKHDDRSCGRGWFNDPFCEAAKAAQNAAYAAEYAACQATPQFLVDARCEAEKAAANARHKVDHDLCELDKARLKGQCELYKELVKQAREVANVSGELHFDGRPRLCLNAFRASSDLSTIDVTGTVSVDAVRVDGSMRYVPLNIPGHLGCPSEWTRNVSASVRVPSQEIRTAIPLQLRSSANGLLMTLEIPSMAVAAKLQPAPFEAVFAQHPDLTVVCPGPVGILGAATLLNIAHFAATGNDLVPALRGDLTVPLEPVRLELPVHVMPIQAGTRTWTLTPVVHERAIEFTASLD